MFLKIGREFKITTNSKCSEISNTFLFLFLNKMLGIRTGTHKILLRIANRGDLFGSQGSSTVLTHKQHLVIILFDLILYVPSTIFQLYRDMSSWVEPVLS